MGKPWGNCSSHRPWSLQHGALANVRRPSAQIRDELRVHRAGLVGLLVLVTSGVGAELASDQCIQVAWGWICWIGWRIKGGSGVFLRKKIPQKEHSYGILVETKKQKNKKKQKKQPKTKSILRRILLMLGDINYYVDPL